MNLLAILSFLSMFGCHPTAAIVPADRTYYEDGVIYMADEKEHKYVHEAVHDCQYQKHGKALTQEEHDARERDAMKIELMWIGKDI